MAIVNGIGNILHAIISGVVSFIDIIISFLSCGYCGGRRRRMGGSRMSSRRHHGTTTSRI
jgi:predicted metal-binding protein